MNRKLLTMLAAVLLPTLAFGKAAYYGKADMVQMAEVIALVEIAKVEPASVEGKFWTYSEKATAKVEQTLKGELPENITLFGGEDFICAQVRYKPGQHLVFLSRDGKLLTGVNWHLGVRPVRDEKVEWFVNDTKNRFEMQPAPLKDVLSEIRALLNAKENAQKSP